MTLRSHVLLTGIALAATLALTACKDTKPVDDTGGDGGGSDGGSEDGGSGDGGATAEDCGDSTSTACSLAWETDDNGVRYITQDEAIGEGGDRDWFAFNTEPGTLYQLLALGYYLDGDSEPDTVLRLYDNTGTLVATNDDMPSRFQNTDSGLVFEAQNTGPYFAEVLEWSDWDESWTGGASGGPDYEYTLYGRNIYDFGDYDPEPDNDDVASLAQYTDAGNYIYYGDFISSYAVFFAGNSDSAKDVDLYAYEFSTDSEDAVYTWAMWPGPVPPSAPEWRLYDEEMNLVGETSSPMFDLTGYYFYDYGTFYYGDGIVQRIKPQTYYLEIVDGNGNEGTGTGYAGMVFGYVPEVADIEEESGTTAIGLGQEITMDESTTTAGFYFGRFAGELTGSSDQLDSWKVAADSCGGSLNGKYLNVYVSAEDFGSLLDPKVTIYDGDAATVLDVETTNEFNGNADPVVADLELTGVASNVFIVVEAESHSGDEYGNSYFVSVTVTDDAQH